MQTMNAILQKSHTRSSSVPKRTLKKMLVGFGFTDLKSEHTELPTPTGHANIEVNWIWTIMKEHPPIAETDQVTWPHRSVHKAFSKTSSPCSFSCLRAAGSNLHIQTYFVFLSYPSLSQMSDLWAATLPVCTPSTSSGLNQWRNGHTVQCLYIFLFDWQQSPQWKSHIWSLKMEEEQETTNFLFISNVWRWWQCY